MRVALQDGLRLLKRLRLRPVCGLGLDKLESEGLVKNRMKSARSDLGVGVGLTSEQLCVFPVSIHCLHESPGDLRRSLSIVRDDLCLRDAAGIDGAVYKKNWKPGLGCPSNGGDRAVCPSVGEKKDRRSGCDGRINQVVLSIGVIIVCLDTYTIAKLNRPLRSCV